MRMDWEENRKELACINIKYGVEELIRLGYKKHRLANLLDKLVSGCQEKIDNEIEVRYTNDDVIADIRSFIVIATEEELKEKYDAFTKRTIWKDGKEDVDYIGSLIAGVIFNELHMRYFEDAVLKQKKGE